MALVQLQATNVISYDTHVHVHAEICWFYRNMIHSSSKPVISARADTSYLGEGGGVHTDRQTIHSKSITV